MPVHGVAYPCLCVPVDHVFQDYCTSVCCASGGSGARLTAPGKARQRQQDDFDAFLDRLDLLKQTIPTPAGGVLRYVVGEVYKQHLVREFGPKQAGRTWNDYSVALMQEHPPWFKERGLGFAEMAVLVDVMMGLPESRFEADKGLPLPRVEDVDELVHAMGEECEVLWALVRPRNC